MTAQLHALPVGNLIRVSDQLRAIADEVDAGKYGDVTEGAMALFGGSLEVFGIGRADSTTTHYILARAQRKMERIDLL